MQNSTFVSPFASALKGSGYINGESSLMNTPQIYPSSISSANQGTLSSISEEDATNSNTWSSENNTVTDQHLSTEYPTSSSPFSTTKLLQTSTVSSLPSVGTSDKSIELPSSSNSTSIDEASSTLIPTSISPTSTNPIPTISTTPVKLSSTPPSNSSSIPDINPSIVPTSSVTSYSSSIPTYSKIQSNITESYYNTESNNFTEPYYSTESNNITETSYNIEPFNTSIYDSSLSIWSSSSPTLTSSEILSSSINIPSSSMLVSTSPLPFLNSTSTFSSSSSNDRIFNTTTLAPKSSILSSSQTPFSSLFSSSNVINSSNDVLSSYSSADSSTITSSYSKEYSSSETSSTTEITSASTTESSDVAIKSQIIGNSIYYEYTQTFDITDSSTSFTTALPLTTAFNLANSYSFTKPTGVVTTNLHFYKDWLSGAIDNNSNDGTPTKKSNAGTIAGSVVGSVGGLILCTLVIWFIFFKRKKKEQWTGFNRKSIVEKDNSNPFKDEFDFDRRIPPPVPPQRKNFAGQVNNNTINYNTNNTPPLVGSEDYHLRFSYVSSSSGLSSDDSQLNDSLQSSTTLHLGPAYGDESRRQNNIPSTGYLREII
ncbi:Tda7p [Nakaseomyces bracarensis]|uniref:Tda7p n=1 Tax=Nakaseomyces bracarensis TaxID=273131 RepID=UPI00387236C0